MLFVWILVESLSKFDVSVSFTKTETFYSSFHVPRPPSIYDSLILLSLFNQFLSSLDFFYLLKVTKYNVICLFCVCGVPHSRLNFDLTERSLKDFVTLFIWYVMWICYCMDALVPTQWTIPPPLDNTVTLHHQLCYHDFRCVHIIRFSIDQV